MRATAAATDDAPREPFRPTWVMAGPLAKDMLDADDDTQHGVRTGRTGRVLDMADRLAARRGNLPIPDRQHLGLVTYDAKDPDTAFPPIEGVLPPDGAPNVLIVLLDDVGFGASSAFGGPANTPTAERLKPAASRTTGSTRRRSARRRGRPCSAVATTTRSAWAGSPRRRRPRRA